MTTELKKVEPTGIRKISGFLNSEAVKEKFTKLLGTKGQGFIASVLSVCNQNTGLQNATTESIYASALMAATLDLPINANLGFAYIIPYKNQGIDVAQFQVGYKGFIQLALRSGQFKTISCCPIFEGQIKSENPLTGYEFDFSIKATEIVGYAAYFSLLNGFEKTLYMTREQVDKHAKRFSKSYKGGFGIWKDDFDGMALKTVIKSLLSKYAPMSIEMQRAVITDQAIIIDDQDEVQYPDNTIDITTPSDIDKEKERKRIIAHIEKCKTYEELEKIKPMVTDEELQEYFDEQANKIK